MAKRQELTPEISSAVVRDEYRELVTVDQQTGELATARMEMPRRLSAQAATALRAQPLSAPVTAAPGVTPEPEPDPDLPAPVCPEHGTRPLIPAGVSKAGRSYPAFYGCERGCKKTKGITFKKWVEEQAKTEQPAEETSEKGEKGEEEEQ